MFVWHRWSLLINFHINPIGDPFSEHLPGARHWCFISGSTHRPLTSQSRQDNFVNCWQIRIRLVCPLGDYSPGGAVITTPRSVCLRKRGFSLTPSCSKMFYVVTFGKLQHTLPATWSGPTTEKIGTLTQRGVGESWTSKAHHDSFQALAKNYHLELAVRPQRSRLPPSPWTLSVYWGWLCPAWREPEAMKRQN